MKKNYLSSNGYCILLALSLQLFNAKAQATYTFNYTGSTQNVSLPVGNYDIKAWGGDGYTQTAGYNGKGGYASGTLTLLSAQTIYIYVGGLGSYPASGVTANAWTFNGGGIGYPASNASYGNGGGASDIRTVGGTWDNPTSLASRVIVAGGGGAGRNSSYIGGNGGGLTGGTGTYYSPDQTGGPTGGSQTAGGSNTGYTSGLTLATLGKAATWDGNAPTATWFAGGGGGYYGGATGRVAGGGGSSYIGGVTNGVTIMFGQPGFVANPDVTGNGYVIIQQLNTPINVTSSSSAICIGAGPVTMTASGVTTYTWLPVGSFAGSNSAIITDNPTSTTVYTVQGTDALGLSVSQFTIYVGGGPINVNVPNPVICAGQSSTLVASGASTYNWSSQSGGFSTITTGTLVINTNSMSGGGYDVIGTDSFGCNSPVASLTITVLSPAAAISGPSITCKGNYYTLSASGADTYTWSTGSNSSSISVSPNVNTVYTLIGGQSQGNVNCYNTASLSVTAYNSPGVGAISNRNNICSGENVLLTAIGAINYTWTNGVTTHTGSTWQVNPISNQTTSSQGYTVTGSNQYNCSNTSTIAITVNPCTGIAENTGVSKLSIYPNPNKGEFVISAAQAMELQLINETGQVLKTIKIDKDKTEIKLNNLSNGIYFIVGKGEQGTVKEKIIVEK